MAPDGRDLSVVAEAEAVLRGAVCDQWLERLAEFPAIPVPRVLLSHALDVLDIHYAGQPRPLWVAILCRASQRSQTGNA